MGFPLKLFSLVRVWASWAHLSCADSSPLRAEGPRPSLCDPVYGSRERLV